jgi:hypothetical protein
MVNGLRTLLIGSSLALAIVAPQNSAADTLPRWGGGIRLEDSSRRDLLFVDPLSASWLLRGDNKAGGQEALRFDALRYPRSPASGFRLSISPGAPCTPVCVKLVASF